MSYKNHTKQTRRKWATGLLMALALGLFITSPILAQGSAARNTDNPNTGNSGGQSSGEGSESSKTTAGGQSSQKALPISDKFETAVFAGGCFWGVEGVFEYLEGVQEAISGYSGGEARLANYTAVSRGLTQHAEAVYVTYDPEVIGYQELLDVFFTVAHNPTQLNYQGPDHGTQYRSEIFFTNSSQRDMARQTIDRLEADKTYDDPIVTKLSPLEAFYPAEEYHQNFMQKNPNQGYVVYWDWPKIEHLEQEFPELFLDAKWR